MTRYRKNLGMKTGSWLLIALSLVLLSGCEGSETSLNDADVSASAELSFGGDVGLAPPLPANFHGNGKGNGGDAVVCFQDLAVRDEVKRTLLKNQQTGHPINPFEDAQVLMEVSKVEMLDTYEYQLPTGFPPVSRPLMSVMEPFTEVPEKLFRKLAQRNSFGELLLKNLKEIPYSQWVASPGVVEIDDSNQAFILPNDCLLVQMAVRHTNYIYYDLNLFNRLSELDKVALILHEMVYKVASDLGQTDSRHARSFVGLLLSANEYDQMTSLALAQFLSKIGDFAFQHQVFGQDHFIHEIKEVFPDLTPKTFSFADKSLTFDYAGLSFTQIDSISLATLQEVAWIHSQWAGQETETLGLLRTEFSKGKIKSLKSTVSTPFRWKSYQFRKIGKLNFTEGKLSSFEDCDLALKEHPKFSIQKGLLDEQENLILAIEAEGTVNDGYMSITSHGNVEFYPNRSLRKVQGTINQNTENVYQRPGLELYLRGGTLSYSSEGQIIKYTSEAISNSEAFKPIQVRYWYGSSATESLGAENVLEVDFYPTGEPHFIKFSGLGHYSLPKSPWTAAVNQRIELDKMGNLVQSLQPH